MDEKNKSENFALFTDIFKLDKIRKAIGDLDPRTVENELFAQFDCYTEKEKIEFEAKYIKNKLSIDEYKKNSDVENNMKIINLILKNIDEFRLRDISKIKRYLVLIELKYDLKIGLVSEVENIYQDKVNKLKIKNDYDKYPIDYVIPIDSKKLSEEKDNKKKKEL
jgi:hypothetical protein